MPRAKSFNKDEVLTRAINLFWKKGYSATSIQDLVDHLGINRASLYDTYGDKEQLFIQAIEQYRKSSIEGVITFLESQTDIKKGFKKLFEIAIDDAVLDSDRKGCFVVNTTTELVPGDEYILKILEKNKATFEKLFYDFLKKGVANGQISKDKDLKSIVTMLLTLYNGIKVLSKVNPKRTELIKSVNLALSLLD